MTTQKFGEGILTAGAGVAIQQGLVAGWLRVGGVHDDDDM